MNTENRELLLQEIKALKNKTIVLNGQVKNGDRRLKTKAEILVYNERICFLEMRLSQK